MELDLAMEAFHAGDDGRARVLTERVLAQDNAPPEVRVEALCMLSRLALRAGALPDAASHAQRALEIAEATDDRGILQAPMHLIAAVARLSGDLDRAAARYRASIELNEELGVDGAVAVERRNLAYVQLHLGNPDDAERLFDLAHRFDESRPDGAVSPGRLLDQAVLAAERGAITAASSLLAQLDRLAWVPDPDDAAELATLRRSVSGPDSAH